MFFLSEFLLPEEYALMPPSPPLTIFFYSSLKKEKIPANSGILFSFMYLGDSPHTLPEIS